MSGATGLLEGFEGYSSKPYQDSGGTWTIGYGSTRDLTGEPVRSSTQAITEQTARMLLVRDAHTAAMAVVNGVKVPLGPEEVEALTSFVYNVGVGAFLTSTLLRLLNAGDYSGAANEFPKWDHAGGRVVHGLLTRRLKEEAVFASDIH